MLIWCVAILRWGGHLPGGMARQGRGDHAHVDLLGAWLTGPAAWQPACVVYLAFPTEVCSGAAGPERAAVINQAGSILNAFRMSHPEGCEQVFVSWFP